MKTFPLIFFILSLFLFSCEKEKPLVEKDYGKLQLRFSHKVDADSLQRYSIIYQNAAANAYEVDELKYFISDARIYINGGNSILISDNNSIHYVDLDVQNSLEWDITDLIPVGNYDSISFIFGLSEIRNQSNFFLNPPEVNMFWPEVLGGGYHYMMFNGKWRKPDTSIEAFNLHLGKGQIYSGTTTNPDSIIGFVHNYFRVSMPNSAFSISKNATTQINLLMNINNWFNQPQVYDLNYWGPSVMQNQAAMNAIKENGQNVFSISSIH